MYFQFLFVLDRVKALAPQHPEWKDKDPSSWQILTVSAKTVF